MFNFQFAQMASKIMGEGLLPNRDALGSSHVVQLYLQSTVMLELKCQMYDNRWTDLASQLTIHNKPSFLERSACQVTPWYPVLMTKIWRTVIYLLLVCSQTGHFCLPTLSKETQQLFISTPVREMEQSVDALKSVFRHRTLHYIILAHCLDKSKIIEGNETCVLTSRRCSCPVLSCALYVSGLEIGWEWEPEPQRDLKQPPSLGHRIPAGRTLPRSPSQMTYKHWDYKNRKSHSTVIPHSSNTGADMYD